MAASPSRNQSFSLPRPNDKQKIIEHYDLLSPYYRSLWGDHLHHAIEKGMFVELQTTDDYARLLASSGLHVTHREVLNKNCVKTWDIGLEIIKDKNFWALAVKLGPDFVAYLKAFQAMRAGFASGNFVYGLFVASANSNSE